MDMFPILVAFLSLGLGGILKGATGAGAPLVAVPALALLFDVPTAIAIFSLPNLLSNAWQGWSFRECLGWVTCRGCHQIEGHGLKMKEAKTAIITPPL